MKQQDNSKIYVLIGLVVIIMIIFGLISMRISSINPNVIIFDTRLFYSPPLFYSNIALYTAEIRMYLLLFRMVDMFFPLFYALLLIQLFIRLNSKHVLFPLVALIADLMENVLLAYKMFVNQSSNDLIIYVINVFTITKALAILISIYMIISLIIKKKSSVKKG